MRLIILFWLLLLSFLLVFVFGPAYGRYSTVRQRLREAQRQVEQLRKINSQLRKKIKQINEDPSAIEEVARYKYRMGCPGEVVYVISTEDSSQD